MAKEAFVPQLLTSEALHEAADGLQRSAGAAIRNIAENYQKAQVKLAVGIFKPRAPASTPF